MNLLKIANLSRINNMAGLIVGSLIIEKPLGRCPSRKCVVWQCRCRCGRLVSKHQDYLTRLSKSAFPNSAQCGCLNGCHNWPERHAYHGAKSRCNNRNDPKFKDYGGRGIEFKYTSFPEFWFDTGKRPTANHSIGRIDNDGNYEPGNVRWETKEEQANNTRTNKVISISGESNTLAKWGRHYGISMGLFWWRVSQKGMDEVSALTTPVRTYGMPVTIDGVTRSVTEWCEINGVSKKTADTRLRRGWDPVRAVTSYPVPLIHRRLPASPEHRLVNPP